MDTIELRSDNSAGIAPDILTAINDSNVGTAVAYGADHVTARLEQHVREVFEHDTARVFPVGSGTAANALALSALCPPWGSVLCHETAHILNNEGGATSMFGAGVVMTGIGGADFRMAPDALRSALASTRWGDPHASQPAALSFTQPTDMGTVYAPDDVATLSAIVRDHGMRVHLDGARFANALAAVGCTPAELTWRAGVDMLSLGAIKNGGFSADAIVSFDDRASDELVYRAKRAGHVTSKMRFQSVQLIAYLTDELWLRLARCSNERMAQLAAGLRELGVGFVNRPDVNMLFVEISDDVATRLERAGLLFYRIAPGLVRFVTSWQTTEDDVDGAIRMVAAALPD